MVQLAITLKLELMLLLSFLPKLLLDLRSSSPAAGWKLRAGTDAGIEVSG